MKRSEVGARARELARTADGKGFAETSFALRRIADFLQGDEACIYDMLDMGMEKTSPPLKHPLGGHH